MAQGRMLSKASSEDEALNRCSLEAHLLYVQTLPHLDRDGLVTGRPLLLWRLALPLRVDFIDITGRLIEEWVQQGLVVRYPGKDGPVLFFKGFRRHNAKIYYEEERPSVYPPPPGWVRTPAGLVPEDAEQRLTLAESFDVRSSYRKALLDPGAVDVKPPGRRLARSRPVPGQKVSRSWPNTGQESARNSPGSGRLLAYQDQTEDQDQHGGGGDHSLTTVCAEGGEGAGRGGPAQPTAVTHLLQFDEAVLRRAAVEVGPLIFGSEFRGYGNFVANADAVTLAGLLAWIGYFWDRMDRTEGIRDLAAYIRGCLKHGDWPQLTTRERQTLVELIVQVQGGDHAVEGE
jgi:hypothetical protein